MSEKKVFFSPLNSISKTHTPHLRRWQPVDGTSTNHSCRRCLGEKKNISCSLIKTFSKYVCRSMKKKKPLFTTTTTGAFAWKFCKEIWPEIEKFNLACRESVYNSKSQTLKFVCILFSTKVNEEETGDGRSWITWPALGRMEMPSYIDSERWAFHDLLIWNQLLPKTRIEVNAFRTHLRSTPFGLPGMISKGKPYLNRISSHFLAHFFLLWSVIVPCYSC
jgi:hypothetical protein